MTAPVLEVDELVAAAQLGKPGAVDALIREAIHPQAVKFCRSYVGNRLHDPAVGLDDVVQTVVLAVVKALPTFRADGGPFGAFVAGIARHKAADAFRASSRNRSTPVADLPEQLDQTTGPEAAVLQAELADLARTLITTLPERQQRILMLRLIDGRSAEETAALLDMTAGSVRVAQHRALNNLRARLHDHH